jgi:hypothetical protein
MASLKSRKALYEALKSIPGVSLPKTYKDLSNEVYGRKAVCYPSFDSIQARRAGEDALEALGFKPERAYGPGVQTPTTVIGGHTASVPVSYFKGWHWDE